MERPCREPSLPFADSAPSLDLDWPREQRSTEVPVFIYEESPERAVYCAGNLLELLI